MVGCFDVYIPVNSYDHVNDVEAVSSLHCNNTFFPGQAWLKVVNQYFLQIFSVITDNRGGGQGGAGVRG